MEALQMMRLRKIRRIPVVSGGHLVRLLTEGDLKRAEPSTLSDTQEQFMAVMEGTQVNRIMIENLITTTPDTPLIDAARTLFKSKYGALLKVLESRARPQVRREAGLVHMYQRLPIAESGKKSLRDRSGRRRSTNMLKTAVLILPLFLVACNDAAATAAGDLKGQVKPQAGKALPSAVAQSEDQGVTGTVVETMDAGAYTYVRMKTAKGDIWAAVNQTTLKPGAEITIGNAMWMENFESKTLNRKFDHILFGSLAGGDEMAALPPGHPPTSSAAATVPASSQAGADQGDVKVEKAAGKDARTVAEIWAGKASFKGQEVVVRARVVKFNAEIMGRNWIHLRDGSGSAEKGDNDITVTTMEVVAKGDIVTIRGKVGVDRDFTAGYAYPVIIEDAKVVK